MCACGRAQTAPTYFIAKGAAGIWLRKTKGTPLGCQQNPGVDKIKEPPSSSRRRATVHRTVAFKLFDSLHQSKTKGTPLGCLLFWSRIRESNPPSRLGKPLYYRYTNPASLGVGIIPEGNGKFNPFLSTGAGGFLPAGFMHFHEKHRLFQSKE